MLLVGIGRGFFSLSFFSFVLDWIGGIDAEVRLVLLILL